ncbi:hypothetical protein ACLBYG_22505 [Methylobacterium sp. D53M]
MLSLVGITRADIPNTTIFVTSFRVAGYKTAGDYGAGAHFIRAANGSGPGAVQDKAGNWFQFDLSSGEIDAGWCGVVPNVATDGISLIDPARPGAFVAGNRSTYNPVHPGVINSNALDLAFSLTPIGGTLILPLGDIPNVGWTVGDGTNTTLSTKSCFTIRSKGGRGGVSAGLFGTPRVGTRLLYTGPQGQNHVTVRGPLHSSDILMGVLVDGNDLANVNVDIIHTYDCRYGYKPIRSRSKSTFLRCIDGPLFSGLTQGCMDNNFYGFEAIGHTLSSACAVHLRGGEANNVGCSRNNFWGGRFEIGGDPNWGAIVLEFADNNRFHNVFCHDGANPNTGGKSIWYVQCTTNPIFPCDNFFSGAFIHGDGGVPGTQGNVYSEYAVSDGEPLPIGGPYITSTGLVGNIRRVYVDGSNSVSQPAFTSAAHQGSGLWFPADGGVGLAVNGAVGIQVDASARLGVGMAPVAGYGAAIAGDVALAGGSRTIMATSGSFLQVQAPTTVYLTTASVQRLTADASGITVAGAGSFTGPVKVGVYTVATLPTPGTSGRIAKTSNGCALKSGGTVETSGSGTGCVVEDSGSAWRIIGTNITVSA